MKTILIIIGILLALSLCAFLLPAIIGIAAGIPMAIIAITAMKIFKLQVEFTSP